MKITMTVDNVVLSASLNNSEAARDFASMLPLTLPLKDYAATEKISDLPSRLSVAGSPEGTSAAKGDIAFYAPWGNLAIFYRDSGYASGLIKIGQFDEAKSVPSDKPSFMARFELAEKAQAASPADSATSQNGLL